MSFVFDEFRESSLNNKIKVSRNMAQCIVDIHRDIKLENLIIDRGTSCLINAGKYLQLNIEILLCAQHQQSLGLMIFYHRKYTKIHAKQTKIFCYPKLYS